MGSMFKRYEVPVEEAIARLAAVDGLDDGPFGFSGLLCAAQTISGPVDASVPAWQSGNYVFFCGVVEDGKLHGTPAGSGCDHTAASLPEINDVFRGTPRERRDYIIQFLLEQSDWPTLADVLATFKPSVTDRVELVMQPAPRMLTP